MKLQADLISLGNADPGPLSGRASSKEVYDREQMLLDGYRVVPLVWLPHVFALSSRVRDWQVPEPGQTWALADVWLEGDTQ